jgi:AcrR family transcriptional regulator
MSDDAYQRSKAKAKTARRAATSAVKNKAKLAVQDVVTDATTKVAGAIIDRTNQLEPPWWRGPKGKSARVAPISRDAIVEAAIRILDAEGVDALTIRRLATELDTGPATLYWHIAGKEELGELVYDRLMGEVELPEPDPERWEDQIKAIARQGYQVMLSHNDAVKLSIGRVPMGPNMLRMIEWSLALLRGAGIPDDVASYFGDLLGRYIDASVLEVTAAPALGGASRDPADVSTMVQDYFSSLPPDQFPNLLAMAATMFKPSDNERFEMGIDILVRGLAAHIAAG